MPFQGRGSFFSFGIRRRHGKYIAARVAHFSRVLRLSPRAVAINQGPIPLGSCSADNCLTFTWRMIMAPPEVIDFIVVHELSHMKIRNHSRDYWRFIESILPGYKEQKVWLRENSHLLMNLKWVERFAEARRHQRGRLTGADPQITRIYPGYRRRRPG